MTYNSVVFIGYCVPTIPKIEDAVGDPNGPGFVLGEYIGLPNEKEDLSQRFELFKAAAEQALENVIENQNDETLYIFCGPEFYFRGKKGAYEKGAHDYILPLMKNLGNEERFANWMFCFGTLLEGEPLLDSEGSDDIAENMKIRDDVVNSIQRAYAFSSNNDTKNLLFDILTQVSDFCQSHPLYSITGRMFIYKNNCEEFPDGLCIIKEYISHEDFVLSLYSPDIYSETSCAYPTHNTTQAGRFKESPGDAKCLFSIDGIRFAAEICLDHRRGLIAKSIQKECSIDIHLVVSCGMQLQQPSIVAKRGGGLVFNTDGQYAIPDDGTCPDAKTESIFSGSADGKAHTQLCQVQDDGTLTQPSAVNVIRKAVIPPKSVNIQDIFAYGAGELHIHGPIPLV